MGRPSRYKSAIGEQLIEAMARGLSLEAAAAKIGVGPRTLFTWQNKHEEFRQAIQEGRQRALLFWEEQAISMAKGAPGNAQLVMLALKNRSRAASGWHDAQRLEHTGGDGGAIQTENRAVIDASALDPAARAALRAAMLTVKAGGG